MPNLEWVDWNERVPSEGEAMLVIFYNMVAGLDHMQPGSIIRGQFWYDYKPVKWMPFPKMPKEFTDINDSRKGSG